MYVNHFSTKLLGKKDSLEQRASVPLLSKNTEIQKTHKKACVYSLLLTIARLLFQKSWRYLPPIICTEIRFPTWHWPWSFKSLQFQLKVWQWYLRVTLVVFLWTAFELCTFSWLYWIFVFFFCYLPIYIISLLFTIGLVFSFIYTFLGGVYVKDNKPLYYKYFF